MPRRKKNARKVYRPRKFKNVPRAVILPLHRHKDDGISPGRLVAIAEWRCS
ncbi:hypothetical protein KQI88_15815 [Alkaliphilus sp. MSJ-5]|uniref:Uncharacterized protein n=1 Tax=Alkaliphilus flagellatus TaxID=2841507 RepID=A0ABS6G5X8_9FIRM|nr:hypothetical protein [Alkaliphilus flagellatus]MBU5677885.1 hypothetical protein [Alkaliphilus flagellatus]